MTHPLPDDYTGDDDYLVVVVATCQHGKHSTQVHTYGPYTSARAQTVRRGLREQPIPKGWEYQYKVTRMKREEAA